MKKLVVVFFTLWSVSAFASIDLFSAMRAGSMGTMHFSGSGFYYDSVKNVRTTYLVAETVTLLDAERTHINLVLVTPQGEEHYALILQQSGELFSNYAPAAPSRKKHAPGWLLTVYAPLNKYSLEDLDTYKKAGWGYVTDGNGQEQAMLLNYLYTDGNRFDTYIMVKRNTEGRLIITSSGTIGNDTDGMIKIWSDQVKQLD